MPIPAKQVQNNLTYLQTYTINKTHTEQFFLCCNTIYKHQQIIHKWMDGAALLTFRHNNFFQVLLI